MNKKIKNIGRFIRRIILINPNYGFKPINFFQKTKLDFEELILGKDNFVCYVEGFKIKMDSLNTLSILDEIFNHKNYYQIRGNKKVLDLGGYYGESALDLSLRNKEVHTYEPEKHKFEYLKKNINQRKNIRGFNYAVVGDNSKTMTINKKNEADYASSNNKSWTKGYTERVKCINIKEVLKNNYDAIKCDIEGGEFPLIEYFLENPKRFNFKQGIFEFHFWGEEKQLEVFKDFIKMLKRKKYNFQFLNETSKKRLLYEKIISKIKNLEKGGGRFLFFLVFEKKLN